MAVPALNGGQSHNPPQGHITPAMFFLCWNFPIPIQTFKILDKDKSLWLHFYIQPLPCFFLSLPFALVKVALGPHGAVFRSEFSVLTMSSSPGDTWAPWGLGTFSHGSIPAPEVKHSLQMSYSEPMMFCELPVKLITYTMYREHRFPDNSDSLSDHLQEKKKQQQHCWGWLPGLALPLWVHIVFRKS